MVYARKVVTFKTNIGTKKWHYTIFEIETEAMSSSFYSI